MILQIISLTLPALISGIVMILTIKIKILGFLNAPLDHNLKINNIRLFGDNKTYRGPIIFVAISILISSLLRLLYFEGFNFIHPVFSRSPILIGVIFGLSYTIGELINSFIKRQKHISPGGVIKSNGQIIQHFFDLTDGIIVMVIISILLGLLTIFDAIAAALVGTLIHIGTDKLMRQMKLKQKF